MGQYGPPWHNGLGLDESDWMFLCFKKMGYFSDFSWHLKACWSIFPQDLKLFVTREHDVRPLSSLDVESAGESLGLSDVRALAGSLMLHPGFVRALAGSLMPQIPLLNPPLVDDLPSKHGHIRLFFLRQVRPPQIYTAWFSVIWEGLSQMWNPKSWELSVFSWQKHGPIGSSARPENEKKLHPPQDWDVLQWQGEAQEQHCQPVWQFFFFCLFNSLLIVWITNFHYFDIFCWFSELSSFLLTEFNSTFPPTSPTFDCRFLEEQEDSQAQEVHEAWGLVHGDIMANTTYDMMVLWQCNVTIITVRWYWICLKISYTIIGNGNLHRENDHKQWFVGVLYLQTKSQNKHSFGNDYWVHCVTHLTYSVGLPTKKRVLQSYFHAIVPWSETHQQEQIQLIPEWFPFFA